MTNNNFAVVIPAFNESATIFNVVTSIIKKNITPIVVDDGSSDNTGKLATEAGAIIVKHSKNKGYEEALSTGIQKALEKNYKFAITFDSDDQLDPNDLNKFIKFQNKDNSDLVIGVRDYRNRYIEYLLGIYGRFRFGIRDPLCGMKLYKLDVAKSFLPFDSLSLVGMEMSFRMIDSGCKYSEVSIHVNKRHDSSRYGSSFYGEIKIARALMRCINLFGMVNKK